MCSTITRDHHYISRFYDAMATGVVAEQPRLPGQRLRQLLQALENATHKSCDVDNGAATFTLYAHLAGGQAQVHTCHFD